MKILLDTCALLWLLAGDDHLGENAKAATDLAGNDLVVSSVSLWEIAVKQRIGKLKADVKTINKALAEADVTILGIKGKHLEKIISLPEIHKDPFDHLLIAQAISEDLVLLTSDAIIPRYPVEVMDARK